MERLTDEQIQLAVRRVFTVRRKQFGNFPNYPLIPLVKSVLTDLQKMTGNQWTQSNYVQVKEYILDNLEINASLMAE